MGICFRKYLPDEFAANPEFQVVEVLDTPDKPARDKKEYRAIKLHNGLKVLLISDLASLNRVTPRSPSIKGGINSPGITKVEPENFRNGLIKESAKRKELGSLKRGSQIRRTISQTKYFPAASLCVGVGHLENPREIQGLMHFLEHMVFMGSEKYPKENAFENFINKCGGSDNARTDYESTNFFFSIEESHFKESLDMFAQFFISPLMKKEAMQRERKAVHSEFQNRVDSDECRKHQILASLANADHPISFFKEGNEKTLQLEISDDELNSKLHDLRRKYYTAQFMTLTVQARETLDVLQDMVVKIFAKIPNNGLEKPTYESLGFPYSKEKFHRLLKIIPVDDEHILELNWVFSPLHKYYESKPLFYVSHFLGHEGYGSLLSYLKRRVWAFSLTAGNGENGLDKNSICEMFNVTIHLTDEGLLHVKDIIKYLFEYLNLLKKETIHEGLVLELHKLAQIEFDHSEEPNPLANVVYSSEMMQIYPLKHINTGPFLFLKNDISVVKVILSELDAKSCNIIISSKTFESENLEWQTEEWFGTKYLIEDIPEDWVTEWENSSLNTEFYLPNPNNLIPDNFDVHKWNKFGLSPPKEPQNILSNNAGKLWFKQDFKFNLPKAYCIIYFYLDGFGKSPEMGAMLDLFINLFNQHLMEALYEASLALYCVSISADEWGYTVNISGFNQKLFKCLETVLSQFEDFEKSLEDKTFDAMKTQLLKVYHDSIISADILQNNIRFSILQEVHWPVVEKMKALENIEKEYFLSTFMKELVYERYVNMLVQGNITADEAKKLFDLVTTNPPANLEVEKKIPKMRVRRLKAGEFIIRVKSLNEISSNSAIINYYQGEKSNLREEVIIELLDLIMSEPLFDTLRTKEQLGYEVYCSDRNTYGILGFFLSVNFQADKYSSTFVNERMESFLKTFSENLKNTSKEDFERYKESLRSLKLEEDFTLAEELHRNWAEIEDGNYLFSRLEHQIEIIPKITLEEVYSYLQKLTSPSNNSEYRKLSIQVVGPSEPENGVLPSYETTSKKSIEEILEFLPATEKDFETGLKEEQFISNVNHFIDELSFFTEDEKADL